MTIQEELRIQTRPLHDKLENDLDLLKTDFSLQDYIDLLKRFYGIYVVLEPKLPLSCERKKIKKLEADLIHLGVTDLSQIPTCQYLPAIPNESFLWGIIYVLEGSTLGGQVFRKHFEEKFHLKSDQGIAFFSGYGPMTMPMWKSFQHDLITFGQSKSYNPEHVIEGAKATFRLLNDWLI